MDKIELVVKRIDDLKESTESKIDAFKESTDTRLDEYNLLLKDHIKRTNILESLHMDNEKRIELLEEPKKARKYITTLLVKCAAVCGAVMTIMKLYENFG